MKASAWLLVLAALLGTNASEGQPPQDAFLGTWVNIDPETGGLTQLVISTTDEGWQVHAWGSCEPTDCDWSTVPLHLIGSSVLDQTFERAFATWDPGFVTMHLMMRLDGDQLVVEDIHIFKDESGRSNYRSLVLNEALVLRLCRSQPRRRPSEPADS